MTKRTYRHTTPKRKKPETALSKVVVLSTTRDQIERTAKTIADEAARKLPIGTRVVVAVTDYSGEWVGVGSNTHPRDVESILQSALLGAGKRTPPVIDIEVEEVAR